MYDLFHIKNKFPYGIIIGAIGLVLTHNVIAVYTAIFCFVYLLIHYKRLGTKPIMKKILICVLLILLGTSFYTLPLLEHMISTSYEVFLPERMYKDNTLISSKLGLLDLFFTNHYEMNFHIGFAILFGMLLTFWYRKKLSKRCKKEMIIFAILGLVSVIMTLNIFPYEHLPSTLKMIQFPWRMMEFASLFFSIIAGIGFAMFMNRNSKEEIYLVFFLILYMSVSLMVAKKNVEIPFDEERYRQAIPVTASTGRVHAGCASFEYLPQKAFANRSYVEQRTNDIIVLEGSATISETKKENTNLTFKVEQAEENTTLELPYIYYLGYSAKLEKEDGNTIDLTIEESDNGFCKITVPSVRKGTITISYTGTTLMQISYVLSAIGWIGIVWLKLTKIT